jgi:lipopolysaccharide transport system ATP-binding protein
MMSTVIRIENLSKSYLIRHQQREPYLALRDVLTDTVKGCFRRLAAPDQKDAAIRAVEEFWALKDVSFEVSQGDRIGIIGRNGAGKSTLLKILSRITEPTGGRVSIKGRIASLLEVGTGFHPELTGRENIFLNGAILGMSKSEIRAKFDEIVAFAEVEKFLDTPVKRYSSGMYVRLAFSVAAHLEPEILLVDEVLAVGDIHFQKKCLGKMQDTGHDGRTVFFVSHNMDSLSSLCNKGILLSSGQVHYMGDMQEAIREYSDSTSTKPPSINNHGRRGGEGGIRIKDLWIADARSHRNNEISLDEPLEVCIDASASAPYRNRNDIVIGIGIDTRDGRRLATCVSSWVDNRIEMRSERSRIRCLIPFLPLVPDTYLISASISAQGITLDYVEHCGSVHLVEKESAPAYKGRHPDHGRVRIPCLFEVENV